VREQRGQRGIVLVMVLFFALLLVSSIAAFQHRAAVDTLGVRTRDRTAQADALARGGVELAVALLLEDRLLEAAQDNFRVESRHDLWAQLEELGPLPVGEDASLALSISDAGARLDLNALFDGEGALDPTEAFLTALLSKVVEEMPGRPEEKNYDVPLLAQNLIDWVDPDDARARGGLEDEPYQAQDPPYRAPNRPLLSVQELRRIEGFDGRLVEALEPYVDVFPLVGAGGLNPNTAPTWVLTLLFHGIDEAEKTLADADQVADIAQAREEEVLCATEEASAPGRCLDLKEVSEIDPSQVFPPLTGWSDVFRVRAEARVGPVRRRLEVWLDRKDPLAVRRLAWRTY
jgi:general secretion pathway protein K